MSGNISIDLSTNTETSVSDFGFHTFRPCKVRTEGSPKLESLLVSHTDALKASIQLIVKNNFSSFSMKNDSKEIFVASSASFCAQNNHSSIFSINNTTPKESMPSKQNLIRCLQLIWFGEFQLDNPEHLLILSSLDTVSRRLLEVILAKRSGCGGPKYDLDFHIRYLQKSSSRRLEEQVKYVFKWAFKNFMSPELNPIKKGSRKLAKPIITQRFYERYFGEISRTENIPLEKFVLPGSGTKSSSYKTFKNEYFQNIKKSPEFIELFRKQLLSLEESSSQLIKKELEEFVDRISQRKLLGESLEDLEQYIQSKDSKLPWTRLDIKAAIQLVSCIISS